MNIFDPIMWPLLALMIIATSPLFYVPAGTGILIYCAFRKWQSRRVAKNLAKMRNGPHTFGGPANGLGGYIYTGRDDVPVMIAMGEYSFDGGESWHKGGYAEAFRKHHKLDEADQFGGFDRTPRYRHNDK